MLPQSGRRYRPKGFPSQSTFLEWFSHPSPSNAT
ncbi:gluconate transporter domain protein, partial [Vibrio cholerae HC-47A1]